MAPLSLDARLKTYADLPEAERAAVRAEVREHRPDLGPALAERIALAEVVDAARTALPDADPDPATALVDGYLGYAPEPPEGSIPPDLEAHLGRLASESEAPLAMFERLTGRRLAPLAEQRAGPGAKGQPAREHRNVSGNGRAQSAASRPAVAPPRQGRSVWQWGALAGLALAMIYGGLFAVSAWDTPERARVADVADVAASFRPVRSEVSDAYAEAVGVLESAERSALGLFPRYDEAGLDRAAEAFETIARENPEGLYGQEAALALGRIRLAQGDDEAARIALAAVVAQRGHRAPEAARLLDYLDAQAREAAE
jgi:hypothetical protein